MATVTWRVDGLTEARSTFKDLPLAFKERAVESFEHWRQLAVAEARSRAPVAEVDGGTLRDSIGSNTGAEGLQVAVGSGDPKARFVEFATNDTPAQPFLYPAFRIASKFVRKDLRAWADDAGARARFKTKRGRKS